MTATGTTSRPRTRAEVDDTATSADPALVAAADLGLLALAFGTAAAFTRLFDDWSFLNRLAVPILIAWASAVVLRHLHIRLAAAVGIHLGLGVVVLTVLFAPGTHLFGLPSTSTVEVVRASVTASFSEFSALVAPVGPTDGFLVVIAAGMWVFALFADTAAFRFDGPVQAVVPYGSTFLATGLLANDSGRLLASIVFVSGLAVFGVTERALRASESRWVGPSRRRGSRAVGSVAALIGVCAVLVGAVLGPVLPGGGEPVIDLRDLGEGTGPRTVVSPFVGLRSLLGARSDSEMFTVRADQPAYWRLTALEEFDEDRDIWVSRGSYRPADGPLPSAMAPDVTGTQLRQDIEISGLSGVWLPGAYEPRQIATDTEVSFDRDSASIILRQDQGSSSGPIDYRLDSVVPDLEAAREAPTGRGTDLDPAYLTVPDLAAPVAARLDRIVEGTGSPFEGAIALQNYFRDGFSYDEDVDFSDTADPLLAFLEQGRGFCQQFSSAFALMARSIGLPSRVAIGFTPGDPVAATGTGPSGASDLQFVVRGRHAHAWPEIYFEGVGWVPFEPTPGRGDPQTAELTGAEPGQATAPPQQAATTTSTVAPGETTLVDPGTPTTSPGEVDATAEPPEQGTGDDPSGTSSWVVLVALVGFVSLTLVALGVARRTRARPRRPRGDSDSSVGGAWERSMDRLAMIGLRPRDWETPSEFAERVVVALRTSPDAVEVPDEVDASEVSVLQVSVEEVPVPEDERVHARRRAEIAIRLLAAAETARRYGTSTPSAARRDAAEQAADQMGQYVRLEASRRQKVEHFIRA